MDESRKYKPEMEIDERLVEKAEAFAISGEVLRAWASLNRSEDWDSETLLEHLRSYGVKLPGELTVRPLDLGGKPGPDFVPWTIRLSRCRTYYVRDEPDQIPREHTVCFGFEIVQSGFPGGPIG